MIVQARFRRIWVKAACSGQDGFLRNGERSRRASDGTSKASSSSRGSSGWRRKLWAGGTGSGRLGGGSPSVTETRNLRAGISARDGMCAGRTSVAGRRERVRFLRHRAVGTHARSRCAAHSAEHPREGPAVPGARLGRDEKVTQTLTFVGETNAQRLSYSDEAKRPEKRIRPARRVFYPR